MPEQPNQQPTVFVVSPIGEIGTTVHKESKLVLDYVIRKALPAEAFTVIRADDEQTSDSISVQIVRRIAESDYIVAVLTDKNPNVFYELAIAHGFAKPVIAMMAAGQTPPFDVNDQRTIFYDLADPASVDNAKNQLRAAVSHAAEHADAVPRNPVTAFRQFAAIERSSTPTEANESLAVQLSLILSRLSRIEQGIEAGWQVAEWPTDERSVAERNARAHENDLVMKLRHEKLSARSQAKNDENPFL